MKQKIKKIGKFIKRYCFELTMFWLKGNKRGRMQEVLFSYRDFLAERGRLRRKAKRKAKREQRRKKQKEKKAHFIFIKTIFRNGLQKIQNPQLGVLYFLVIISLPIIPASAAKSPASAAAIEIPARSPFGHWAGFIDSY